MASPVTLSMAKQQCGIAESDTSRDALLGTYIAAAIDFVETRTGQALEERQFSDYLPGFGTYLELSRRPVISITSIGYLDSNGEEQDFTDYAALLGRYPVRIYPAAGVLWPTALDNSDVVVTYIAGYDDDEWPMGLVQATLLLVGHWFANRETVVIGVASNEVQFAVDSLCGQKRAMFV